MRAEGVEAVVLRKFEMGEADLGVELFTYRWGRIHALAKGGRKSHRRFMNKLEPFKYIRGLFRGRRRGLMLLEAADIIRPFFHLTEDLKKTIYAFYAVELVRVMTPMWDPHPQVLELLLRFFNFLEEGEAGEDHLRVLELRMLTLLGYRPRLDKCVRCGGELVGGGWFSLSLGGVVCKKCKEGNDLIMLSEDTLKVLSHLLKGKGRAPFLPKVKEEARRFLPAFIRYHTDRDLLTLRVMDELGV